MFKLICGKCGSVNVLEQSEKKKLAKEGAIIIYGKGVQRKCTDCDNEDFVILKTWVGKDKSKTDN